MPPLTLLIKPASGSCNLCCRYCFYADEAKKRTRTSFGRMTDHIMHTLVDKAMDYAEGECTFAFQGGEPTLMGLGFYQNTAAYIRSNSNFKRLRIHYSFQTNGILLDDTWAEWFAQNRVLVGISLDGPKDIHDRYRLDQAGKGTFHRVMGAIRLLEKHRVDYNILSVVTGTAARNSQQIYALLLANLL